MMKWIFSGLILLSVVFGALQGRMDAVSNAAITECGTAVELTLTLMGSMCMWSGLMKVAQRAKLTEKISRLFAPLIRVLFDDMDPRGETAQAVCLNISANLLGLGNAATPLGISAMRRMSEDNTRGPKHVATNNMCVFVVLNTASLQILPTTTALLRANAGSPTPMDIMPASWLASAASIVAAVTVVKLLQRLGAPAYEKQLRGAEARRA